MHSFKDFGIVSKNKGFEGDKIRMDKILNRQIVVENFKIDESKFKDKGSGKLLTIQIIIDNTKRIVFTGSLNLMDMIQQVPNDKFPFMTTIVKENDQYNFI